jgi:hypothetical protein
MAAAEASQTMPTRAQEDAFNRILGTERIDEIALGLAMLPVC